MTSAPKARSLPQTSTAAAISENSQGGCAAFRSTEPRSAMDGVVPAAQATINVDEGPVRCIGLDFPIDVEFVESPELASLFSRLRDVLMVLKTEKESAEKSTRHPVEIPTHQETMHSVARWISSNFKLEGEQVSAGDIIATIQGMTSSLSADHRLQVERCFDVLMKSHRSGHTFLTPNTLCELHRQLYPVGTSVRVKCAASARFREVGAFATDPPITYLRHTVIEDALKVIFSRLRRFVLTPAEFQTTDFLVGLKRSFALSTLVLFHLNDVHPFCDGNGRLSRLVSTLFLGHHCPLPVCIPRRRTQMLQALTAVRAPTRRGEAPNLVPLCQLLIECAIETHQPAADAAVARREPPRPIPVVAECPEEAARIPGGPEAWATMSPGETRIIGAWELFRQ
ncbi:hypothetical protein PAPYR_7194 [Paratrimastix pyriformis]|uniref:Fido domain-containing protein n=1 Tax=Paratrimastix pyriformis TaxID=342808 RepID=A0ABQ8UKT1_9EUKA|nr:hypothetical protein PAPYR_7194 [Paratrimastix pyriformis]